MKSTNIKLVPEEDKAFRQQVFSKASRVEIEMLMTDQKRKTIGI